MEDHNASTFTYSGMWVATHCHASSRAVFGGNISEENCASIFKVVNIKAVYSSKMFVTTYQTTLCHIPVVKSVFTAVKTPAVSLLFVCEVLCRAVPTEINAQNHLLCFLSDVGLAFVFRISI